MQIPLGIVYAIALAEGVKIIPLPRMLAPGHDQGIDNRAASFQRLMIIIKTLKFSIQKTKIKRGVVNNQLSTGDIFNELVRNLFKFRFVGEKFTGNAVDLYRALVYLTSRIDVLVIVITGKTSVNQLDTTNLDDAMALRGFKPRGFSIQYDLSHTMLP